MKIRMGMIVAAMLAVVPAVQAAQDITKRASVAPDVSIEVSNVQGSVEVTAWDRNEVELVAHLKSDEDQLEFDASGSTVTIEVERPDRRRRNYDENDDATLTLRVPRGARLDIDTVSADIKVNGVRGDQRLESVSGNVVTQAFDAPVSVASVSGSQTVTGSGGKAAVRTENVSGTTTVTNVRGSYDGEVVSGELRASVAAADKIEVNSVSGDVEIDAELTGGAHVEMESVSGQLSLRLKPPVNASFEIETFSGRIENCFGPKPRQEGRHRPGRELSFTQGDGGARVELETLSGTIEVCDR